MCQFRTKTDVTLHGNFHQTAICLTAHINERPGREFRRGFALPLVIEFFAFNLAVSENGLLPLGLLSFNKTNLSTMSDRAISQLLNSAICGIT